MKILIAEKNSYCRAQLTRSLRTWGYQVDSCADGLTAVETLRRDDAPDLVIVGGVVPPHDGLHVCKEVRKLDQRPYVYLILLGGGDGKRGAGEALEAGADDYVLKPFEPQELKGRVQAGSRIVRLQHNLIQARRQYEFKASHDLLTGLWNRAAILESLGRELARSARQTSAVGIIMADVDRFKSINDAYGHLVGDAVLKEIASRIRSCLRSYDSVGRYGGEEFMLVLPGCNGEDLERLAERLRSLVASEPVRVGNNDIHVTMSLGLVAVEGTQQNAGMDALIHLADKALYRAKELGRNRVGLAGQQRHTPTGRLMCNAMLFPTSAKTAQPGGRAQSPINEQSPFPRETGLQPVSHSSLVRTARNPHSLESETGADSIHCLVSPTLLPAVRLEEVVLNDGVLDSRQHDTDFANP